MFFQGRKPVRKLSNMVNLPKHGSISREKNLRKRHLPCAIFLSRCQSLRRSIFGCFFDGRPWAFKVTTLQTFSTAAVSPHAVVCPELRPLLWGAGGRCGGVCGRWAETWIQTLRSRSIFRLCAPACADSCVFCALEHVVQAKFLQE